MVGPGHQSEAPIHPSEREAASGGVCVWVPESTDGQPAARRPVCYKSRMTDPLSRRERQIMDILHRVGRATVGEVRAELEDPPTYSTVRALMTTLETKGHLRHTAEGKRYVYAPTEGQEAASRATSSERRGRALMRRGRGLRATLPGARRPRPVRPLTRAPPTPPGPPPTSASRRS